MNIIQIVPQLPPATSGVGDYALNIARQLRQFSIETHFIVANPDWKGAATIEDFAIAKVEHKSASALMSLLSQLKIDRVLLHYVGYGYARRGCPFWLIKGLEEWHGNRDSTNLVTMFHETYASSYKPWTSSFWSSLLQKHLLGRLSELSDRKITSLQEYGQIISKLSHNRQNKVITFPVFSNIGEPKRVSSLADRKPQLVVFGGRGRRTLLYQNSAAQLNRAGQVVGIEKIIDIGPATGLNIQQIVEVPVLEMGKLKTEEVSQFLLESKAGFFDYNIKRLAKSTIFASYCSHGTLAVSPQKHILVTDGIEAQKHYWTVPENIEKRREEIEGLQKIADNAYQWYQNHRLSMQGQLFSSQLDIQQFQSLV